MEFVSRQHIYCLILTSLMVGCAQTSRYQQVHDSAPIAPPENVLMHDAVPKHEPYAQANQRPYTIRGVNYTPLPTGKGYSAEGLASWYGQKFHGHLTSNGEVYDMYTMTAAHKTLPLPSFARVTNLENGNQALVRINDRGPFHSERLLDLSYAAALKLGMLSSGVAKIKMDVVYIDELGQMTVGVGPTISASAPIETPITPNAPIETPITPKVKNVYIQVAALQDKNKIDSLGNGLTSLYQIPYQTPFENGLYRLQLGPLSDEQSINQLLSDLKLNGYQGAYKVYLP
jgi:rare lipoprotein A